MKLLRALLLTALGLTLGAWLPDLDLKLSLFGLLHRSILTHGCLLPLLGCWLTRSAPPAWRFLLGGFCAASASHLTFDLFPAAWNGYALITIPLIGRTSALLSWLWIATSILVCLVLLVRSLRSLRELALMLTSGMVVFVLSIPRPLTTGVLPLLTLVGAMLLALMLAAPRNPQLGLGSTRRFISLR